MEIRASYSISEVVKSLVSNFLNQITLAVILIKISPITWK